MFRATQAPRAYRVQVFARLAVVSLVIVAGVFIYSRWDKIQPENILLWLNDKLAGGESGDGSP